MPRLGLELSTGQISLLWSYFCLFNKWNKAYNLSAIRRDDEVIGKHLFDSLSVARFFSDPKIQRVADIGTGGGLPGIPLSIVYPDRHFHLIDSAGKKVRFLFQVVQELGLANVQLSHSRVEEASYTEAYDVVISRAFATIAKFAQLAAPLIGDRGQLWAMKGVFPSQELSEIEKHYIVKAHHQLDVPDVEGERCLIQLLPESSSKTKLT